jgi:hypothetical protein
MGDAFIAKTTSGEATWFLVGDNNSAPGASDVEGVYQLWVDYSDVENSEDITFTVYETVAGGSQVDLLLAEIAKTAADKLYVSPDLHLRQGWDFGIGVTDGDAVLHMEVRRVDEDTVE